MNTPTALTLGRIAAIPVLLICYYLPFEWAHPLAAFVFLLCAITDWLDGYLARRNHQMTPLGAFLDPVADKLVIATVIVMVIGENYSIGLVVPAVIIIGREIAISALREWMCELGKRSSLAVSFLGKLKTALQMAALFVLLLCGAITPAWFLWLGSAFLYVAAGLTLWSMINYLKIAWPDLTSSLEK